MTRTAAPRLPGTKPILTSQPDGPSFTIKDGEVSWQNWKFRFRLDPRVGPIVNLVTYNDGSKARSVLYEGGLAEMYVPYQDPEETWNSHVFLDAGEYFVNTGSGGIIKPLLAGVDCSDVRYFFQRDLLSRQRDALYPIRNWRAFRACHGRPCVAALG